MKKIIFALIATLMSFNSMAEVTYQVIPLPQSIKLDPSGKSAQLIKGQVVSYPADNAMMKRNAQFAQEFLGLTPQAAAKKVKTPVNLTLGLQSENPDAYQITIDKKGITIQGASESGVFYGIQTLRKSVALEEGDTISLPFATITGEPRFQYRGTMLDCARHFFPVTFIKEFIDILALHGVNKADPGDRQPVALDGSNGAVPFNIDIGGFPAGIVKVAAEIVQYAQERYITIIPEIDLPGHMVAALSVYPNLGCTGGPYFVRPYWGVDPDVLCAGNPETLKFIHTVLGELCEVFPSKYIHVGGDESPRDRWKKCEKCQNKKKELQLDNEAQLQTYILKDVEKFLSQHGRELIGWDEILEGGLSEGATVMSWRGYKGGITAARLHHRVIMTPTDNCYIDYYQLKNQRAQPHAIGGYLPLSKVYAMEPIPSDLTEEEGKFILGAQCNLWTEYVLSPKHAEYMLLPRLDAMCEVQWLQPDQKNFEAFTTRLADMEKLYRKLGYSYCTAYE